jgi:hypothetical protein
MNKMSKVKVGVSALMTLVSVSTLAAPSGVPNVKVSVFGATSESVNASQGNATVRAAMRSLMSATRSLRLNLPSNIEHTSKAASLMAGDRPVVTLQPYNEGIAELSRFAEKIKIAETKGNAAAGLPASLDLKEAKTVLAGLISAILLLESNDTPACHITPVKVRDNSIAKACATSGADATMDARQLQVYLANTEHAQIPNSAVYIEARQLMLSMLSGAGLTEYLSPRAHTSGRHSAYALLWTLFVEQVQKNNGQPIVSFVQAFQLMQNQLIRMGQQSANPMVAILTPTGAADTAKAMKSFFGACARVAGDSK